MRCRGMRQAVLRSRSFTSYLASLLPPRVASTEVCVHLGWHMHHSYTPVICTDLNNFLYLWIGLFLFFTAQAPVNFTQWNTWTHRRNLLYSVCKSNIKRSGTIKYLYFLLRIFCAVEISLPIYFHLSALNNSDILHYFVVSILLHISTKDQPSSSQMHILCYNITIIHKHTTNFKHGICY